MVVSPNLSNSPMTFQTKTDETFLNQKNEHQTINYNSKTKEKAAENT